MKWFTQSSRVASEGVESPWFVLNEQRADRLLWNQGWFVSQAQARQMLQHKRLESFVPKIKRLDDVTLMRLLATYASIASPRTFVKPGDILYWRGSRPKTSSVGTSQRLNHYTFPSSLHVGSTSFRTSVTPWVPMIHSPHLSVHVNQPTLTSCLTSSEQGMGSQASSDASLVTLRSCSLSVLCTIPTSSLSRLSSSSSILTGNLGLASQNLAR